MSLKSVYVIDATRTPVGKYGGSLSSVRPDDMAGSIIKSLMTRNPNLPFQELEEVILGAANQAGEDNRNVARMAILLAGLPTSVAGYTVNRLCASGLQSIINAFTEIQSNMGQFYLAGGVESMTRAPFVMAKSDSAFSRKNEIHDTTIGWRFINDKLSQLYHPYTMGETAENVAEKWKISREEQDLFAFKSQEKWQKANELNKFEDEISSIIIKSKKEEITINKDEQPRLSSIETLATLKPAFKMDGTVTAGNSSSVNDGAAILAIADENFIKTNNIKPLARIVSAASSGVEPAIMGIGPVEATKKALKRAGLSINQVDLMELNEAFASQSIACIKEMGMDPNKVNVNGGSIAIGHPLGCSGSRISSTLLHELKRNENARFGVATMCIGVGQGLAVVYEKV